MKILFTVITLLTAVTSWSQITTTNFDVDIDAMVNSGNTSTNYGTNQSLKVYHDKVASPKEDTRAFIKFDISSLPDNAIIYEATLKVYADSVNNAASHPLYIERADTAWTEGGITWNNQPGGYSSDQISVAHNEVNSTGWHEFDVTDHVEQMHWYNHLNYGWRIRLQSESGGTSNGIIYNSSEHDSTSRRPELEVKYILPPDIDLDVTHSANGADDGSVDVTYSGGSGGTPTYYWMYKWNAGSLGVIQHGANPDDDDMDKSSLAAGLYHIRVRDSLYGVVADNKFFFSKWFMVGEEGETTAIDWYYNESYMYDVTIARNKTTDPNPTIMKDINYDYTQYVSATESPAGSGTKYEHAGLQRWNMDFDQLLDFTKADLIMRKHYHYRGASASNAVDVRYITEPWIEDVVTWNIRPSVDSTVVLTYPQTEPYGTSTDPDTTDYRDIVEYWQANHDLNYGLEYSLTNRDQSTSVNRMWRDFHFSSGSGPVLSMEFTVKETIETAFNDTTNLGAITVNAPAGDKPYKYLISHEPLPVLDSIWNVLKDSIEIDSSTFFQGQVNRQNYTFSNLPPERYYVAAYDNSGTRILTDSIVFTGDLIVYDSTDITVDGDTLEVASQAQSATATLFNKLELGDNGGLEFEIVDVSNGFIIGFNHLLDSLPTADSLYEYAAELRTNSKIYFRKGANVLDSSSVSVGDRIRMMIADDIIDFEVNGSSICTDTISGYITSDLKLEVGLKSSGSKFMPLITSMGGFGIPKLYTKIEYIDCAGTEGQVKIMPPVDTYFDPTLLSWTLYDDEGTSVATGTTYSTEYLEPGVYTLDYTFTVSGTSYDFSKEVVIGHAVDWINLSNISEVVGTVNSISPTLLSSEGTANSANETIHDRLNWVQFQTTGYSIPFDLAYERLEFNDGTNQIAEVSVYETGYGILSKFVVVSDDDSWVDFFIAELNPIRVEMNETDLPSPEVDNVSVYYNGTVQSTFVPTSNSGDLSTNATVYGKVKLENTISNYCYFPSTYVAKTKCYLDGSYYFLSDGVIDFQYTGEYNTSDLVYELYDYAGNVMTSPTDYTIEVTGGTGDSKVNADNRYTMELASSLSGGFYLLKVTNVKGEEHYIRLLK